MAFEFVNVTPPQGSDIGPNDLLSFDIRSDEMMGQVVVAVRYPRIPHSELAYVGAPAFSTPFETAFAEFSTVSAVTPGPGFVEQWHFALRRTPRWIGHPTVSVSSDGGAVGAMGPPGDPGPAGPVGPAGPAGTAPPAATGAALGYLTRSVYVNAESARIGSIHAGAVIQSAPAQWVTPEDVPAGRWFQFIVFGGGGGGGGGAAAIASGGNKRGGGGGGGGARHPPVILSRADLIAALPVSFTVGLGGLGGAGGSRSIGGTSAGSEGTPGGASEVLGTNLSITAGAGFNGSIFGTRKGAGGGVHSSGTETAGGLPNDSFAFVPGGRLMTVGGGPPHDKVTSGSGTYYYCLNGGASGGAVGPYGGNTQLNGMNSRFGGCGGGHGGAVESSTYGTPQHAYWASEGGNHDITGGIIGGGGGVAGIWGDPGGVGADGDLASVGGEGGGGGGSYAHSDPPPGPGGRGGDGGFPSGGGGGGGSLATSSSSGAGGVAGGDGGNGGDGCVIIDAFF